MRLEDYLTNFSLTTVSLYWDNYAKLQIVDRNDIDKHAVTQISVR